ncbi:hypothetical protein LCGC14_2160710 [marine sediment metagenome]|uniref:HIT-type domain-containing protein n=1 Tax=marine sediment metagenome TaxID=412755 RepID=A0A0F9EF66_9ZZZZ
MESRLCPVCHKGKVWLCQNRTCSQYCSIIWRRWNPDKQAEAVESAKNESLKLQHTGV